MSSTNRGKQRAEADFYPTPHWCVDRLLQKLKLPSGLWLEPGAGNGDIIRAVSATRTDINWAASELRPECAQVLRRAAPDIVVRIGNFLGQEAADFELTGEKFDVAIGNPPFRHAIAFVRHALTMADHVVLLLRLNFLGSQERADFMRETGPDIYILPDRPSFEGDGDTDSIEYAWFHWSSYTMGGDGGGAWHMLDSTPLEVRKAAYEAREGTAPKMQTLELFK